MVLLVNDDALLECFDGVLDWCMLGYLDLLVVGKFVCRFLFGVLYI